MGKNGKEKGQELNGKKMELNGGKWERQWRICEREESFRRSDEKHRSGTDRSVRQMELRYPRLFVSDIIGLIIV